MAPLSSNGRKRENVEAVASKQKRAKKEKVKDPQKPKRPPTAFLLFMEDLRKSDKEGHVASKSVAQFSKKGGERWKAMSEDEKRPYVEKAAELKSEYDDAITMYHCGGFGAAAEDL